MVVRVVGQPFEGFAVAPAKVFLEGGRCMETGDFARIGVGSSEILEVDSFAVRRVSKRHSNAIEIKWAWREPLRVANRLREGVSGAKGDFLRLNDSERITTLNERIIRRARAGLILFDGAGPVLA
jgi:hypothetical protein